MVNKNKNEKEQRKSQKISSKYNFIYNICAFVCGKKQKQKRNKHCFAMATGNYQLHILNI